MSGISRPPVRTDLVPPWQHAMLLGVDADVVLETKSDVEIDTVGCKNLSFLRTLSASGERAFIYRDELLRRGVASPCSLRDLNWTQCPPRAGPGLLLEAASRGEGGDERLETARQVPLAAVN